MSWTIDQTHSRIDFSVRHMMISNVRGHFGDFEGTIELDDTNRTVTSVDVRIKAESIHTGNAQRDEHLRSADFFDAAAHPYLTFKGTNVENLGEGKLRITGDLTIHGVTVPTVLDAEFAGVAKSPWGTVSAGFSAHTKINRGDFGLNWNQVLEAGGILVGEEIKISIEVELLKNEVSETEREAEEEVAV